MHPCLCVPTRLFLFVLIFAVTVPTGEAARSIIPHPKQIKYSQAAPLPLGECSVAIVLGNGAVEPEEYSAQTPAASPDGVGRDVAPASKWYMRQVSGPTSGKSTTSSS